MKLAIRLATINDLPTISQLNQGLFTYEQQFNKTYNQNWTYSNKGQDYFKKRINNDIVIVAEIDNQVIAYLCGHSDHYSYRSINPIFEIENMAVLENFQRQGIGTKLINKLFEILNNNNIPRVKVGTIHGNNTAISFYKNLGLIEHELFLEKEI